MCKVGILTKRSRDSYTLNPIFPISRSSMPVTSVEPGKDQEGETLRYWDVRRWRGFHKKELTEYWAVSCPHDVVVMA